MTGYQSKKAAALDEEGMYLVHQTASYADNLGKSIVALGKQTVADIEQLGIQPAQEPVAWQWLGSAHFRKKLPKNADITAWNPLYTTPPAAQPAPVQSVESVRYWLKAYSDRDSGEHFQGHGMIVQLLQEYLSILEATPPAAQPADPTGQAPCVRHCEATAFQIVIKNLRNEIERMKAAQRKPLTDEQRQELMSKAWNEWLSRKDDGRLFAWSFSFEVEAAHGIKE